MRNLTASADLPTPRPPAITILKKTMQTLLIHRERLILSILINTHRFNQGNIPFPQNHAHSTQLADGSYLTSPWTLAAPSDLAVNKAPPLSQGITHQVRPSQITGERFAGPKYDAGSLTDTVKDQGITHRVHPSQIARHQSLARREPTQGSRAKSSLSQISGCCCSSSLQPRQIIKDTVGPQQW